MKCSRRTLLKTGSLAGISLAIGQTNPAVSRAAFRSSSRRIVEKVPSICGMCKASCPMIALKSKSGHVRLDGNPNSPIHGKTLCARGMASVQLLEDPDRLKYPLKRTGPRGLGAWKRISWQEAITEIAGKIKGAHANFGPESLALLCGSSSSAFIRKLYKSLSCPNIYDSSHMHSAAIRELGYGTVFGRVPDPTYLPAVDDADCLVLMGCHIGENNLVSQLKQVSDLLSRGSELIVVDPRFSTMASKADQYMAIKPGTDTALLLGWINYILTNELFDPFLADRVVGLTELREVAAPFSLTRTAELTEIPEEKIQLAVETMVHAGKRTVIMPGSHLSWHGDDVDRVRAQAILSALLGCEPPTSGVQFDFESQRKPGSFSSLINKISSGKIKVTGIWGQNPLQAGMAPYKTMSAFKNADFIFACDILPSEPTLYADIVLPECSFLERMDDLHTWDTGKQVITGCRFPVVDPSHECRDPFKIVQDLAMECGQADLLPEKNVDKYLDGLLAAQGSSLDLMKKAGGLLSKNNSKKQENSTGIDADPENIDDLFSTASSEPQQAEFPTPSKKIEFHSSWLLHNGFAPLPTYEPADQGPEGYLRLLYGRCPAHSLTRTAGFTWLNHEIPENELWITEAVAAKHGLKDGDQVRLENRDGFRSLNMVKVKITPGIREDCCYMAHGFGNRSPFIQEAYMRGASDSAVMSRGKVDVVSGTRGLRDTFVRILRGGNDK